MAGIIATKQIHNYGYVIRKANDLASFTEKINKIHNVINKIANKHGCQADYVHNKKLLPAAASLAKQMDRKIEENQVRFNMNNDGLENEVKSVERSKSLTMKVKDALSERIRIDSDGVQPCYKGFIHFTKKKISSKYNRSVKITKERFGSLNKSEIASRLEREVTGSESKIQRMREENNMIYQERASLLKDKKKIDSCLSFLKRAELNVDE